MEDGVDADCAEPELGACPLLWMWPGEADASTDIWGTGIVNFDLDPRLVADTMPIGRFTLCEVRLMDDLRWPWLVLVPRMPGLVEIHDLPLAELAMASGEWAASSRALKQVTGATKINVAAIGNMVRQLHLHVVARNEGDANWPGPVWGHGVRQAYAEHAREFLSRAITEALRQEGMIQ